MWWVKHELDSTWHIVRSLGDSIVTYCRGRFACTDPHDVSRFVATSKQCSACVREHALHGEELEHA